MQGTNDRGPAMSGIELGARLEYWRCNDGLAFPSFLVGARAMLWTDGKWQTVELETGHWDDGSPMVDCRDVATGEELRVFASHLRHLHAG